MSQLVAQYEEASELRDVSKQTKQASFLEKVQRLTNTLEEMGNPFQEESGDLPNLDTREMLRGLLLTFPLGMHPLRHA